MKKIISLLLVLVLALSLAACGEREVLIVGLEAGFPPFEWVDEGDKIVGIDVDIAQYIADKWGMELKIQEGSFEVTLASVSNGNVDLGLSGISRTPEREPNMDFSDPYFESNQVIVVKAGSSVKGLADLQGKKVGAQTGTTGEGMAQDELGTDNVVCYDKYTIAVQDLINGQIEAIVMDAYPAQAAVAAHEGDIIMLAEPLGTDSYCIAVKKGNTELVADLNEIIKELKDSGKLDEIIKKYEDML